MRASAGSRTLLMAGLCCALAASCRGLPSTSRAPIADADRGLVLAVEAGGWDAVSPWKKGVADAYARANAVLSSQELRRRMARHSAPAVRGLHRRVEARLATGRPFRLRFRASVGSGEAVRSDCHGTVSLTFPKVMELSVAALAAELAKVAAALGLRGGGRCDGGALPGHEVSPRVLTWVGANVQELAAVAFSGGGKTVAAAMGRARPKRPTTPQPVPTRAVAEPPAGRLFVRSDAGAATPLEAVLSYTPINHLVAQLRVNARPWASCRLGRSRARMTPFTADVSPGEHRVSCRKGTESVTKTVFIPKRPLSRLSRGRLIVSTDGADRCYIDGIRYDGSGVSVDVAPGVRRVECVYDGSTLARGVQVFADRVIPVHLDVRERRLTRLGFASLTVNARPWARCAVDGGRKQTTPLRLWVKPGRRSVTCEKAGKAITRQVRVAQRRRTSLLVNMEDAGLFNAGHARLTITARPWADCSVDGKPMGLARIVSTVRPGWRTITCERKGIKQTQRVRLGNAGKRRVHFRF